MMTAKTLVNNLIALFYPDICLLCGRTLIEGEECICLHCMIKLPRTNYHLCPTNAAKERFDGRIPVQKASAFLYYSKKSETQLLVSQIKYKNNPTFGNMIGKQMATELLKSAFFTEVDWMIPVPLHKNKLKQRGFNQALSITEGIHEITHIPISSNCLYRKIENPTQTKKSAFERWHNTHEIFDLSVPRFYDHKHVLIVDDVLTTGSTIEACAHPILRCEAVKISVLTVAIA